MQYHETTKLNQTIREFILKKGIFIDMTVVKNLVNWYIKKTTL